MASGAHSTAVYGYTVARIVCVLYILGGAAQHVCPRALLCDSICFIKSLRWSLFVILDEGDRSAGWLAQYIRIDYCRRIDMHVLFG